MFNIAATLRGRCDFFVISLNRDVDVRQADPSVVTGTWSTGPNGELIFFTRAISFLFLRRIIKEVDPDVIFINGIFNFDTTFGGVFWGRTMGKKVIISPRGMLQSWALKRNAIIKSIYLAGLKLALSRREHWHATEEKEVYDIGAVFGRVPKIHMAPNIPRRVSALRIVSFPGSSGKIRLVFLSLINSNKNLHLIVDAVQKSLRFTLDIYGPVIDRDYWRFCQDKIDDSASIRYKGPVPPWEVPALLSSYHFFVLPTQGENFGHAIFDSLASGVPVVVSRNTPWKDIEAMNAGFYMDLKDDNSLFWILRKIEELDQTRYNEIRESARLYAVNYWQDRDYATEYSFLLNDN